MPTTESAAVTGEATPEDLQQIDAATSMLNPTVKRSFSAVSAMATAKASGAPDELTDYGGNMVDLLARMEIMMSGVFRQLRKNATEGKVAELKTQVSAMKDQAGKMRDAAESNHKAAMIQGWFQVGSGAVGLAGGVMSLRESNKASAEIKLKDAAATAQNTDVIKTASNVGEPDGIDDLLQQARRPSNASPDVTKARSLSDAGMGGMNSDVGLDEVKVDLRRANTNATKVRSSSDAGMNRLSSDIDDINSFDDLLKQSGGGPRNSSAHSTTAQRASDAGSSRLSADVDADAAQAQAAARASGRADFHNARARVSTELAQSAGSMITGAGGLIAASFKQDADEAEAQGKELEAKATLAAANLAAQDELAQDMKEAMKRVMDNYKAAVDQEQSTDRAIIQNI